MVGIEIALSVQAKRGCIRVLFTDKAKPGSAEQPEPTRLFERTYHGDEGLKDERYVFQSVACPSSGLALVRFGNKPDSPYELVNISGLKRWILRFHVSSRTSGGLPAGDIRVRLYHVAVHRMRGPTGAAGWVTNVVSDRPVPGAVVSAALSSADAQSSRVNSKGMYLLDSLDPGKQYLFKARAPGFQIEESPEGSAQRLIDMGKMSRVNLKMRQIRPGYGDVVTAIPIPLTGLEGFAVLEKTIYVASSEDPLEARLRSMDFAGQYIDAGIRVAHTVGMAHHDGTFWLAAL